MDGAQGSAGAGTPDFAGCWDIKGPGLDGVFIRDSLTDTALQAAQWADQKYAAHFPGWAVYRLFAAQDRLQAEKVSAYAISMAYGLARARRNSAGRNSHPLIARRKRGSWLVQAALDAVFYGIHLRFPVGSHVREAEYDVHQDLYRKVRDSVAGGMLIGFEAYRAELFYQYARARAAERRELG